MAALRVLFVTSPGIGHIFPTIPTAWALRAAGHDVLMAIGGHHDAAAHAGLPVVDGAPGVDFAAVFGGFFAADPGLAARIADPRDGGETAARMFAVVSGKVVDGVVDTARRFHPDLVVYTPMQGAGPLAAASAGAPSVAHPIGLGMRAGMMEPVVSEMSQDYRR